MASPPPDAFDPDAMLDEIEAELKAAPAPKPPKAPAVPKAAPAAPAPKAPAPPKTAGAAAAPAKPAAPPKAPRAHNDDDLLDERLAGAPPKAKDPLPGMRPMEGIGAGATAPPKPPPPAAPPVMPKGTAPQPAPGRVAPNASASPAPSGMRAVRIGGLAPAPPTWTKSEQARMDYEAKVDANLRESLQAIPSGIPVRTAPPPSLATRWEAEVKNQGVRRTPATPPVPAPNRVGYEEGAAMLGMPPRVQRPSAPSPRAQPAPPAPPPPPVAQPAPAPPPQAPAPPTQAEVDQAMAWAISANAGQRRLHPNDAAKIARESPAALVASYRAATGVK